jgi:hypothetical protein
MKHEFEPTEGFETECSYCCGKHGKLIMEAILAESQIYNRQALMPMYVEPQVTIDDLIDAQQAMKEVLMFGGNR